MKIGRHARLVLSVVIVCCIWLFSEQVVEASKISAEITNSIGMKLVLIPAGEFMMGSPQSEKYRHLDESPYHKVKIKKPFYLGKYEVTNSQYEAVMGKKPSFFRGQNNPVEGVTWKDAVEFCERLSGKEGTTYRLPTEAEWEYACRAATTAAYYFGDDASKLREYGWYRDNSGGGTHPVGLRQPNAWGLYDMHGNVWEWCSDWYDKDYYSSSPVDDPNGGSSGKYRVLRGGSWDGWGLGGSGVCRSAIRGWDVPTGRTNTCGFRVARTQPG